MDEELKGNNSSTINKKEWFTLYATRGILVIQWVKNSSPRKHQAV